MRFILVLIASAQVCFGAIHGNMFLDFEDSTAGTTLTTTILDNGTHGSIGSGWTLNGPGVMEVVGSTLDALSMYQVGSSVYSTVAGTRAIRIRQDLEVTYVRYTLSPTQPELYISGYASFGDTGITGTPIDHILINTTLGGFFVLQTVGNNLLAHGSGFGGGTPWTSFVPNTRYFFEIHFVRGANSRIRIYNATTGAFLAESAGVLTGSGNADANQIRFGRVDSHGDEPSWSTQWDVFDNIIVKTGTGLPFPRGPISEYYVNSSGGNNANPGTSGSPWATVDFAADNVQPGDTVNIVGTHTAAVTPARNGTATEKITFHGAGTGTTGIWTLSARPDIRLVSLIIDAQGAQEAVYIPDTDRFEMWKCVVRNSARNTISMANSAETFESDNCIFIGNTFEGATEARFFALSGNRNIIAYNTFSNPHDDCVYQVFGNDNRIFNNYQARPVTGTGLHTDFYQQVRGPNDDNLIEANLYIDSLIGENDHHFGNLESWNPTPTSTGLIIRRNATWGIGTGQWGIGADGDVFHAKIYNDTYVFGQRFAPSAGTAVVNTSANAAIFNTIAYEAWGATAVNPGVWSLTGANEAHDNNLYYDPDGSQTFSGDASAASEPNSVRNLDPLFVNLGALNFQLQAASPARNAGRHLTTVTTASGTGTSFAVADVDFFKGDDTTLSQYSGSLVVGDTITIGTDVRQILSISGSTITVTASLSWVLGDLVYFGDDTTPDLGPYPYSSSSHNPTGTISDDGTDSGDAGEVFTVSTSGSVRFVVFYESGLPVTIDFSAPFTHPRQTPNSTVTADIAALYPSATPLVAASDAFLVGASTRGEVSTRGATSIR